MASESQVRWLVIGTGDIVKKRVASAIVAATPGRLIGFCGGTDRAKTLSGDFGVEEFYDNIESALRHTTANCVYVATPVDRHRPEAIRSIAAGKHVLIEKPLGLDSHDARAIADAARAAPSLKVACAYYRRCSLRFTHARQVLREGVLGRVVQVRMIYSAWFNPEPTDPKRWRVEKSRGGGGPLADMGSHMIDVLIGLFGVPATVYASANTLVHKYPVEDSASALLVMPDGVQVSLTIGWSSKSFTHEMDIIGSEGRLRWSPYDTGKVQLTLGRDVRELELPPSANVHTPLVEDFVAAVMEDRAPVSPVSEAARTNDVIDAIYRSAATHREVKLG